jgi:hypothetical protein
MRRSAGIINEGAAIRQWKKNSRITLHATTFSPDVLVGGNGEEAADNVQSCSACCQNVANDK